MTGWLGNYFGRKRVLISCIVMFTFASALCGLAWSLPTLIVAADFPGRRAAAPWCPSLRPSCSKVSRPKNAARRWRCLRRASSWRRSSDPTDRRLDHRQLFLALDFLHQPAGRHRGGIDGEMGRRRSALHQAQRQGRRLISSDSACWPSGSPRCRSFWTRARKPTGSARNGCAGSRSFRSLRFLRFHLRGNFTANIRWWICAFSKTAISPSA